MFYFANTIKARLLKRSIIFLFSWWCSGTSFFTFSLLNGTKKRDYPSCSIVLKIFIRKHLSNTHIDFSTAFCCVLEHDNVHAWQWRLWFEEKIIAFWVPLFVFFRLSLFLHLSMMRLKKLLMFFCDEINSRLGHLRRLSWVEILRSN